LVVKPPMRRDGIYAVLIWRPSVARPKIKTLDNKSGYIKLNPMEKDRRSLCD